MKKRFPCNPCLIEEEGREKTLCSKEVKTINPKNKWERVDAGFNKLLRRTLAMINVMSFDYDESRDALILQAQRLQQDLICFREVIKEAATTKGD